MIDSFFFKNSVEKIAFNINSNFTLVDNANILSEIINYARFNYNDYTVEVEPEKYKPLKLFVYTFLSEIEFNNYYKNIPLVNGWNYIFILKKGNQFFFRLKLNNLFLSLSKYKSQSELDAPIIKLDYLTILEKETFSIKSLIDLFEPQFHIYNSGKIPEFKDFISFEEKNPIDFKTDYLDSTNKKLDIEIAIFFDGTANNKYNSEFIHDKIKDETWFELSNKELKTKLIDSKQSNTKFKIEDYMIDTESGNSFMNAKSNIAIMYDLCLIEDIFNIKPLKNKISFKYYITGIGTATNLNENGSVKSYIEDDTIAGQGLDVGKQGTYTKLFETCNFLSKKIIEIANGKEINSLTFDTFGFSRGAALSMLFYNEINLPPKTVTTGMGTFEQFNLFHKIFIEKKMPVPIIKFRFIGLMDSVFNSKDLNFSFFPLPNTNLEIYRDKFFLKKAKDTIVMEIKAKDEVRTNFPYLSSNAPNLFKINLYGVHSDIGGSYATKNYKTLVTTKNREKKDFENYAKKIKEKFSLRFDKKLIFKQNETYKIEVNPENGSIMSSDIWLINKRNINNNIKLVSLYAIIEYYRKKSMTGDSLFPFRQGNGYGNKLTEIESTISLRKYLDWALQLASNSKKDDSKKISNDDYYDIYNRYIHNSDNYNLLLQSHKGFITELEILVNKASDDRQREIIE